MEGIFVELLVSTADRITTLIRFLQVEILYIYIDRVESVRTWYYLLLVAEKWPLEGFRSAK